MAVRRVRMSHNHYRKEGTRAWFRDCVVNVVFVGILINFHVIVIAVAVRVGVDRLFL